MTDADRPKMPHYEYQRPDPRSGGVVNVQPPMTDRDDERGDVAEREQSAVERDMQEVMRIFNALSADLADLAYARKRAERAEAEVERLREVAGSVCFHGLCCNSDCDEARPALLHLAVLTNFAADPGTNEEISEARAALDTRQEPCP